MEAVGITTTIPVEAIYASGRKAVDLNNLFITSDHREKLIERAEIHGFPSTTCAWIKGLWASAAEAGIQKVVGVTGGDCSNTKALVEIWQHEGVKTYSFAYPHNRSKELLRARIEELCRELGTTPEAAEAQKRRLDPIRALAAEVDRLTWQENKVTGAENHLHLVSASDFNGDPDRYGAEVRAFLDEASARPPMNHGVRLGYIGVPTIYDGFYDFLHELGAAVVFNETQRQFTIPYPDCDLVEAYHRFTYPYDVFGRVADIRREIERRRIDGIVHYVQSFCFRQMEDLILRQTLGVPILTLEGDRPGPLDGRVRTRLEGFVEMLDDAI